MCLHFSSLSKQGKKWFGSCNRDQGGHQALRKVGHGNQEDPLERAARTMHGISTVQPAAMYYVMKKICSFNEPSIICTLLC